MVTSTLGKCSPRISMKFEIFWIFVMIFYIYHSSNYLYSFNLHEKPFDSSDLLIFQLWNYGEYNVSEILRGQKLFLDELTCEQTYSSPLKFLCDYFSKQKSKFSVCNPHRPEDIVIPRICFGTDIQTNGLINPNQKFRVLSSTHG